MNPPAESFLRALWARLSRTDLFFDAGAIAFNVLVAFVPLLLLVVAAGSFVATARFETSSELAAIILSYLPPVAAGSSDLAGALSRFLDGVVRERTGFSVVGGLVLLWISTRLVSCLRVALRDAMDQTGNRGIVAGKLFDLRAVLVGGLLLIVNVGVTVAARTIEGRGISRLAVGGGGGGFLEQAMSLFLSFASAWFLFWLIYWHIPARRVPFRTAAVGATFTAAVYEVMKGAFAWYATSVVDYSSAYGGLAVVAILFFWIYYSAVVLILGGHVARTYEVRRIPPTEVARG